jgi:hypothetical protein
LNEDVYGKYKEYQKYLNKLNKKTYNQKNDFLDYKKLNIHFSNNKYDFNSNNVRSTFTSVLDNTHNN